MLLGAEDRATERMVAEHRAVDEDVRQVCGLVVGAGDLLNHDAALLLQLVGVEPRPADEVGEEVDRLDDPVGPDDDEEGDDVVAREGVHARTQDLGGGVDVAVGRMVLSALEDHVLEEMRHPALLGALDPRAGVEGDDRRDRARAVDADAEEWQPVGERGLLQRRDESTLAAGDDRPDRKCRLASVGSALRGRLSESLGALADVFRTGDLRRLGFAYLTSMVALWAYGIAISVYAFQVGGATLVGVSAVIRLLPAAFAAPFVATIADRYPQRVVLLSTDLVRAALIAAACAAVATAAPAALVFVIAGLNTIVSTAFEPAKNSLLPSLVDRPEQLTAANTVLSTFESSSIFLGPAIGGLALALGSVQVAFGLTGALLLLSAAQISRIGAASADVGEEEEEEETPAAGGVLAGFRAIAGDWRLRTLIGLLGAQLIVDGLLTVLTVSVAIDLLGRGEGWVGYLNSAIGVGGLLGAVATLSLTGRRGLAGLLGIGLVGWGVPIALIGVLPYPVAALILLGVLGIANTLVDSTAMTLLQRAAPKEVRGRVFGVLESVIIGSIALGMALAPALIDALGIRGALIASGALLPVLTLIAGPALARIDAEVKPPTRRLERLEGVPMLARLGPVPLEELATRLESARFDSGTDIVRQGDLGDRFYLIDSGEVEVFEDGELARRQRPGDYFGEIALLRDIPRTATVTATSEVEVLALERDDFLEAVTRDRLNTQAAEAVIATRLGSVRRRKPTEAPA